MDRVRQLYKQLSPPERKALGTYLSAHNPKSSNKLLDLFLLVEDDPEISHEQAALKLYDDARSKAFIMMKAKLYEKMTEFLTISINPEASKRNRETPYHHDLTEFRKSMLIATVLQERRMSNLALEYFERAQKLAATCCAPELEVDALVRIRGLDGRDLERYEELSKQIQKALVRQECDINATGLYRKWYALHAMTSAGDEEKITFLQSHIPDLEDQIRQVYSPRADYFLQMLKVNYHYLGREYEECKDVLHKAIGILEQYEGIRSPQRMSDPWFQLGKLELLFQHWDQAIEPLEKARSYHPQDSWAYLSTTILILYAQIYRRDFKSADAIIKQIGPELETRVFQKNPTIRGMFGYLKSCLLFLKQDYQAAWINLQDISDLNFDKGGWITGMRLFEIMVLVDKGEADLATQKLENLRKHLSRHKPEPRMKVIHKLLMAQDRQGFAFSGFPSEQDLLDELQNKHPWDPVGHEVIRFDEWYLSHRH